MNFHEKMERQFHCGRKVRYLDERTARKHAPSQLPYLCKFCGYYHTGHRKDQPTIKALKIVVDRILNLRYYIEVKNMILTKSITATARKHQGDRTQRNNRWANPVGLFSAEVGI